jgi:hypothetical protein
MMNTSNGVFIDRGEPRKHEWPSRAEWAEHRRATYSDKFDDLPVSTRASRYATPAEIDAAIDALRQEWKSLLPELKKANQRAGALLDGAKGERLRRFLDAPEQDQELIMAVECIQDRRRELNRALKLLREDRFERWQGLDLHAIAFLRVRYDEAYREAEQQREREILATPIDDAAWEEELQYRRDVESGKLW